MKKRDTPITAAELAAKLESIRNSSHGERSRIACWRSVQHAFGLSGNRSWLACLGLLGTSDLSRTWLTPRRATRVPFRYWSNICSYHIPTGTREGTTRTLAVPDAREAWPTLVAECRKAPIGFDKRIRLSAKSGLAAALSATGRSISDMPTVQASKTYLR
jgi:hypothetical protein